MLRMLLQLLCLFVYPGSANPVPASSSAPLVVNGAVGETKMLPLNLTGVNVSAVFWYHKQEAIAAISPGADGNLHAISPPKWKGRLTATSSFSVLLGPLTEADAGPYQAQIDKITLNYTLRVFRRLRTLNVTHSVQHLENGTCELQLVCVLPGDTGDSVRFSWKEAHGDTVGTEANLTMSWVPTEPRGGQLSCTAENPISNVSVSISPAALCAASGGVAAHVTPWMVALFVTVALGLLLAFLIFYLRKTRLRGNFCVSTRQMPNPAPGQTPRNTEHVYNITSGNTVYAQVTHPTQETEVTAPKRDGKSSTIYSTVQPRLESRPLHGGRGSALDYVV
ncbi:SLAM family member 6 isoform X2 [Sorex araneus]|uniref:SLAM family member 6 isoform X2 n=1 Tax=Sorex araneus TaxID=42254 RepID=UPI002433F6E9|nr:SLAM family member 6 isoform X2 [Sorex araneus]